MSHITTSPAGLGYHLTHNPPHLTAHTHATLTLTIHNPTPDPIPLPQLTLTLPEPHPDTPAETDTPGPLALQPPQGWTTHTHTPTHHTLTPPTTQDNQPHQLPPAEHLTLTLTNYPTHQPGTTTLHLTETPHPAQEGTGTPHPLPLTLITWPPDPIVTPPTLDKYRYKNGDIASVEWEYSPADDIDYTLTYYPHPLAEGVTVTYAEIKDLSGATAEDGLRHAFYNSVPVTTDPVLFILKATYQQKDTRTYTTIATVDQPDTDIRQLHVTGQSRLLHAPQNVLTGQPWVTPTEGFLVCWTAENTGGGADVLSVVINGKHIGTLGQSEGGAGNTLTLPLGKQTEVLCDFQHQGTGGEHRVTWFPLGQK